MLIYKFIILAIIFLGCECQGKSAKAKHQGGPPSQVGVGHVENAGNGGHAHGGPPGGPPGQIKKLEGNPGIPIGPATPGSGSGLPEIHGGGVVIVPDSGVPIAPGGDVPLGPGGGVTMGPVGDVSLGPGGGVPMGPVGDVSLGPGDGVPMSPGGGVPLDPNGGFPLSSGEGVPLGPVGGIPLGEGSPQNVDITHLLNNQPGGILTINGEVLPSAEQPKTTPGSG